MRHVGIDYSMSCPAMCILGDSGYFKDSYFYFLTAVKKSTGKFLNNHIEGALHPDHLSEQQRFNNIAEYFIDKLLRIYSHDPKVLIEDYSFGSKGKVFHIAENTGLLKHRLWEEAFKFEVVAPTVIKKFATGKGNADKEQMYQAFLEETKVDLNKILSPDKKLGSPVTDIVDSYFIARYLREQDNDRTSNRATGNSNSKQL